jgi:hypothetical protein
MIDPEIMVTSGVVLESQSCLERSRLFGVAWDRPWVGVDSCSCPRSWRLRVWNNTDAPFCGFVGLTRIIFVTGPWQLRCAHLYQRFLQHHGGRWCLRMGDCLFLSIEFCKNAKYKRQRIGEVRRWVLLCTRVFLWDSSWRAILSISRSFSAFNRLAISTSAGVCRGVAVSLLKNQKGYTILGGILFALRATLTFWRCYWISNEENLLPVGWSTGTMGMGAVFRVWKRVPSRAIFPILCMSWLTW